MDAIGIDLQLSDRASEEYEEAARVSSVDEGPQGSSHSGTTDISLSSYQTSGDLATGTTVPVSDQVDFRDAKLGKTSTSSTSSSSSNESRTVGASLYIPEYLTPSISYDRQAPNQLLIALLGRAFDQTEKLASSLQELVCRLPNTETTPVAKFIPFTVKRKALCRGNFDSRELKKHDLICLCYNASEARILLTGQDGYYTALLKQIEILMGPNKVSFLVCNYTPPHNTHSRGHPETSSTKLLSPALKTRLSLQPALATYLDRDQVLSWADVPLDRHAKRLVEIAQLEPNPQGILSMCSVM